MMILASLGFPGQRERVTPCLPGFGVLVYMVVVYHCMNQVDLGRPMCLIVNMGHAIIADKYKL